jgi:hypothetical protein
MNKFLFYASARWFGEACLELVIYRTTPIGTTEIYLLPRPANDPFFAGLLHIPGTRKLPNDTDEKQLKRVIGETPFEILSVNVKYVLSLTVHTKRGTEFSDVRMVKRSYYYDEPDFYNIAKLPNNLVEHHYKIISLLFGGHA